MNPLLLPPNCDGIRFLTRTVVLSQQQRNKLSKWIEESKQELWNADFIRPEIRDAPEFGTKWKAATDGKLPPYLLS